MPHLSVAGMLAAVVVLAAAVTDLRSRRIPNWLTLPAVLAGLSLNCALAGWSGFKMSVSGLLVAFAVYFALYCLRAMGAGDVKLMAAVGAILGPAAWFNVFVATTLAGGVLALAVMCWKGRVRETLWNVFFIVGELTHLRAPHDRREDLDVKNPRALKMPHGVAIAAGTLACIYLNKII